VSRTIALLSIVLATVGAGCHMGPRVLRGSRCAYNEAIRRTADEQLLLNLVRLRYRDNPLFLEVAGVSAQYVFQKSADVSGKIVEDVGPGAPNPDVLGLGGKAAYEERPTITYSILQGREFAQRFLSPLDLETILMLYYSGWSIDRVLRLTVQRMNGIENAMSASGPTPTCAPRYRDFAKVSHDFRALQVAGLLDLGYEQRPADLSDPIPANCISAGDLVAAAREGFRFRRVGSGDFVMSGPVRVPVVRIAPEGRGKAEYRELVEILKLKPGEGRYELKRSYAAPQPDEAGRYSSITIGTRSLLGALFYLSQAVEVPAEHEERGLVTVTRTPDGGRFDWGEVTRGLFRVHCSKARPSRAAVAVRYRGFWFYVEEADLTSKSTLSLVQELFALQAGGAKAAAPVLTLPVGG